MITTDIYDDTYDTTDIYIYLKSLKIDLLKETGREVTQGLLPVQQICFGLWKLHIKDQLEISINDK